MFALLLRTICDRYIPREFVELGVYKGYRARLIHHYAPERKLHLFDTFEGFPEKSMIADKEKANNPISKKLFSDTSVEQVEKLISPQNEHVKFHVGYFPETIPPEFEN